MLLYSLLHLGAYEFPFDQIKQFRQRGSITCWTVGTRQAGLPLGNNHVTLSVGTNINSNEDCAQRFEAYGGTQSLEERKASKKPYQAFSPKLKSN
jgi:transketolase